jgi:hypothetical protein
MARREEGAYRRYVTDEQQSQPGWIGVRNATDIFEQVLNYCRNPSTGCTRAALLAG